MSVEKMHRVNRGNPCPICGKPDWCLVANDGSAAICQRIEDGSVKRCGDAGYLHILTDRHNGHDGHKHGAKRRHALTVVQKQNGQTRDFWQLSARYQSQLTDEKLRALAHSLGVSAGSLRRLRLGWDGRAYTFPMSNDFGEVIGVRRRFANGAKASVKGSKTGLFIPTDLTDGKRLLVCEGATDTAAALDFEFDAIGRPNCNSVVQMTVRAAKGRAEIVVVSDNDPAGRAGAETLAGTLALRCPCLKIVVPPNGLKDLRQWFNAGLASESLRQIISTTPPVNVVLNFSRVDGGKGVCQ